MLGEPAVVARHRRRDAQREALLAEQRVAAVAGSVRPDLARLGEVHDVLVRRCCTATARRPRRARAARRPSARTGRTRRRRRARRARRVPMRVMVRMLAATYAESVSSTPMCAIGEPSGPIENGHDVQRAAAHRARVAASSISARISAGSRQLFVGPASSSCSLADERAVFDPGDVARVAARVEAVRAASPGRAA